MEKLQAALGVTENGTLAFGQAVFEPTAVRVTSVSATPGCARPSPGQSVLSATSTTRQVSIALDAAQQSEVAVGDKVTITLPNNKTTPGSDLLGGHRRHRLDRSGGSSTITVLVNPTDPAATGNLGPGPGECDDHHRHVSPTPWSSPSTPLLAQAGGGYAVEVVDAQGIHRLVPVSLGLFDDADGWSR